MLKAFRRLFPRKSARVIPAATESAKAEPGNSKLTAFALADNMKADLEWERLMKAACQELMQASSEHPDPMPIFTAAMLTLYKISKTETLRKRQEECVLKQALQSLAKVQGSRRADLSQTLWGKAQEAFGILLRAWLRRDPSITHLLMLMKILDGYIQKGKYVRQLCISSGTALLRCAKDMANINMEEILCQISKPLLEDFQRDKWRTNEDDIVVENLDEEELF
ncbi:uncharacterized protein LOC128325972 isoform X2 [Hemicordylus capensis]|uniref:uncharacterized protein LOC128325972 isoform X2 n=1 Tax=Hemicordylus capensis TaxID=884348 RepID=UPI00230300E2|nr:uncharacterized protein LOC128325972 isoform X2 [Hemicordylus capensis]